MGDGDDGVRLWEHQINASSDREPGNRCILFTFRQGVTFDEIIDANERLVNSLQGPWRPRESGGLWIKKTLVNKLSPCDIEIKVLADGKKLDRYNAGGDGFGTDKIVEWTRYWWSREERFIKSVNYHSGMFVGKEKKRFAWGQDTLFTGENPLCVEGHHYYYTLRIFRRRLTGDGQAHWYAANLDMVLRPHVDKVEMLPDMLSPSGNWRSAISLPMDSLTTYDEVFNSFHTKLLKHVSHHPVKERGPDFILREMRDEVANRTIRISRDEEDGLITEEICEGKESLQKTFYKFHANPLILESWQIRGDARESGFLFAKFVQKTINNAVAHPVRKEKDANAASSSFCPLL
mmetsp:Transcript_47933/g.104665  ORF Transcript_47933/g.104665 Transcript_47933/m.104665 type:complete len:348 (+) Transcript_47933:108-1151(+)